MGHVHEHTEEGQVESDGQEALRARLRAWRQAHPQATFDEIEDAVQQEVVRLHAQLVDEVITAGAASHRAERASPTCPACQEPMRPCGRRRRVVLSRLGQAVPLERDYFVCPACGTGLFPPR